jgi:ferric-dicitrate binding protein FerR (iron transport regulator)
MRTFALRCQWRNDVIAGLALFLVFAAWPLNARADDAPAHRAARLSFLQGDVTVDHLDNTAGDSAQVNMPLAEGVRLTTGEDGQAEVEFEDGSVLRLTPNSSLGLNVLSVDPAENFHTQMTVLHGLVYAELRASSKYFYVVDAGGELISPVANATLRINLDQPPATVSVFDGTVQVEHPSTPEADGYKRDVRAGESLTGDASDSSQFSVSQNVEEDSWDEWNRARDQAAADAALNRTAARDSYA